MATNVFSKITQRGISGAFMDAFGNAPEVYRNHCKEVSSNAPDETYSWLGSVPQPRQHLGGRLWQMFNEFTFTVTNNAYECSFIIDRDSVSDDQIGATNEKIGEIAEVVANYKDSLFGAMITAGGTSTSTFTGTAFFSDSITIGSASVDNNLADAGWATGSAPTVAEILTSLNTAIVALHRFQTDKGQEGFNRAAMSRLRVLVKPEFGRVFQEAINSTLVPNAAETASQSNPWGMGAVEGVDELPDLAAASHIFYVSALGASRWPFYYQHREGPEIVVLNGENDVAENNGVKVMYRERFAFAYGDHRRCVRLTGS